MVSGWLSEVESEPKSKGNITSDLINGDCQPHLGQTNLYGFLGGITMINSFKNGRKGRAPIAVLGDALVLFLLFINKLRRRNLIYQYVHINNIRCTVVSRNQ